MSAGILDASKVCITELREHSSVTSVKYSKSLSYFFLYPLLLMSSGG